MSLVRVSFVLHFVALASVNLDFFLHLMRHWMGANRVREMDHEPGGGGCDV